MSSKVKRDHELLAGCQSAIADDGPRAFPILEAFKRIGIAPVTGYALIKAGKLETFLIGRRRYATAQAIAAFLDKCITRSKETAAQRAMKVAAATKASLRRRAARAVA